MIRDSAFYTVIFGATYGAVDRSAVAGVSYDLHIDRLITESVCGLLSNAAYAALRDAVEEARYD
jgi:hypothetical protein